MSQTPMLQSTSLLVDIETGVVLDAPQHVLLSQNNLSLHDFIVAPTASRIIAGPTAERAARDYAQGLNVDATGLVFYEVVETEGMAPGQAGVMHLEKLANQ